MLKIEERAKNIPEADERRRTFILDNAQKSRELRTTLFFKVPMK